jgi:hypothetical protein
MIIPEHEKEQRKKAILALVARWVKNNDTLAKAQLLLLKNQHLKNRRANTSTPL